MKTFKDLEKRRTLSGFTYRTLRFKNGYGIEVTKRLNFYDGNSAYEVEILKDSKPCTDAPIAANTIGYKTEEQVDEIMVELQLL